MNQTIKYSGVSNKAVHSLNIIVPRQCLKRRTLGISFIGISYCSILTTNKIPSGTILMNEKPCHFLSGMNSTNLIEVL